MALFIKWIVFMVCIAIVFAILEYNFFDLKDCASCGRKVSLDLVELTRTCTRCGHTT